MWKRTLLIGIVAALIVAGVLSYVLLTTEDGAKKPLTDLSNIFGGTEKKDETKDPVRERPETREPIDPSRTYAVLDGRGEELRVKPFLEGVEPDPYVTTVGERIFTIAGSDESAYVISYIEFDDSFTISLLEAPLAENRLSAEAILKEMLGISDSELCDLRSTVLVSREVHDELAGFNIGISSCPDAVPLP